MAVTVTFPKNTSFPIEIAGGQRLAIQRKQIQCTETASRSLDRFRVQEITLTNQKSDKTRFSLDDIDTTIAAIVFLITYKSAMKNHQTLGTVDEQHSFRMACLGSRAAIKRLKETSDEAGLFWGITKGAAQDIPPAIPWG